MDTEATKRSEALNTKHLPVFYNIERDIGIRKVNGNDKLRALKPIHKKMIAMHLSGISITEIAAITDKSMSQVNNVLGDPLSTAIINSFHENMDKEFLALQVRANEALRIGLTADSTDIRLKSAKIYFSRLKEIKSRGEKSAEDVVADIMSRLSDVKSINVTNVQNNTQVIMGGQSATQLDPLAQDED